MGCSLERWLRGNPGLIRDVRDPGERNHDVQLQCWHCVDDGFVLWRIDNGICGPAALLHAVNTVRACPSETCYMNALKKLRPVSSIS